MISNESKLKVKPFQEMKSQELAAQQGKKLLQEIINQINYIKGNGSGLYFVVSGHQLMMAIAMIHGDDNAEVFIFHTNIYAKLN